MIDTDDLDRVLRAAIVAAAEPDAITDDPAARVTRRVTRRRHRRIAMRVGAAVVVILLTAAAVGVITTRHTAEPPAHRPVPTYVTPSVLNTPQTPADRVGVSIAKNFDGGAVSSSIRLLTTRNGVLLFGAVDRSGLPCILLQVPERGGPSADTGCATHRPPRGQIRAHVERFQHQGTAISVVTPSGGYIGFFLPDWVKTLVLDGKPFAVTRNGVLAAVSDARSFGPEERVGSTLLVTTTRLPG